MQCSFLRRLSKSLNIFKCFLSLYRRLKYLNTDLVVLNLNKTLKD